MILNNKDKISIFKMSLLGVFGEREQGGDVRSNNGILILLI